jgi:glycerophosphoryl diester phosphodiesterase
LVVAHRGASGSAPENTMAAFRQAVIEGTDMIELDVRLTKDFHIAVHHDRNVRRTTNGKGNVWDLTLQQLRALDAGSWFHQKFGRERIPTLREVMEFLLPTRVNLNIEVKTDGDPRKRTHFEECVILIIMEKRFEERSLVSSFDHKFLKHLRELFPDIKTGALYHPVRDVRKKPSTLCSKIGASAFICSHTQLHQRMIDDARSHKLVVATYGVNTPQHFDKVASLGVDAVVTDWPDKMVKRLTM